MAGGGAVPVEFAGRGVDDVAGRDVFDGVGVCVDLAPTAEDDEDLAVGVVVELGARAVVEVDEGDAHPLALAERDLLDLAFELGDGAQVRTLDRPGPRLDGASADPHDDLLPEPARPPRRL